MQQSNHTILEVGYQLQTVDKGEVMIEHIVLIKIKPSTSQKKIQEATKVLADKEWQDVTQGSYEAGTIVEGTQEHYSLTNF